MGVQVVALDRQLAKITEGIAASIAVFSEQLGKDATRKSTCMIAIRTESPWRRQETGAAVATHEGVDSTLHVPGHDQFVTAMCGWDQRMLLASAY